MKNYNSLSEIKNDLKVLDLEKDVALEELKIVKNQFYNFLKPFNLLGSAAKIVSKYGFIYLIKKFTK